MNTTTTSQALHVRDNVLAAGQRLMAGKGFLVVGRKEIQASPVLRE